MFGFEKVGRDGYFIKVSGAILDSSGPDKEPRPGKFVVIFAGAVDEAGDCGVLLAHTRRVPLCELYYNLLESVVQLLFFESRSVLKIIVIFISMAWNDTSGGSGSCPRLEMMRIKYIHLK